MLYYYCTNSTFASIVKNRSLWLSDMTQSNDSYEIHRYVGIVKEAIEERIKALTETELQEEPQKGPKRKAYQQNLRLKTVLTQAKNKLKNLADQYYCLAICFSDMGNSLSQWRGYGDDGYGISIGFDEERIEELSGQHILFKYGDVQYYSSENDERIRSRIKEYLEELADISRDEKCTGQKLAAALRNWARKILDNDAPFFKPAGFIEERETRFCYVREIHAPEMANPKETSHLRNLDFHVSNTAIIPHYELKLYDGETFLTDIIREVVIGPCNGSDKETVRLFLAKAGFDYAAIKVEKSNIPYRPRK